MEKNRTVLTDINSEGYYAACFSPGSQYYSLRYEGPSIPWQKYWKSETKVSFNRDYISESENIKTYIYFFKTLVLTVIVYPFRFWNSFEWKQRAQKNHVIPLNYLQRSVPRAEKFSDISNNTIIQTRFSELYSNTDSVEALVRALAGPFCRFKF